MTTSLKSRPSPEAPVEDPESPTVAAWPVAQPADALPIPRGQIVIMFTDIEGSVALTRRLGDARAYEILRRHNEIVRAALVAHGGTEVKHTGDGFLATFRTGESAVKCARAIQASLAATRGDLEGLRIRIGINAGEPVVEGRDIFGLAVQIASRICSAARGGTILISSVVRDLAASEDAQICGAPTYAVCRGFENPLEAYVVPSAADEAGSHEAVS